MLKNYRLYHPLPGNGIYWVDFPYGPARKRKRIRKSLYTREKREADKRARELIKAWYRERGYGG